MKATWNGVTIAQSDDTVIVEGNHYFPLDSLDVNLRLTVMSRCRKEMNRPEGGAANLDRRHAFAHHAI